MPFGSGRKGAVEWAVEEIESDKLVRVKWRGPTPEQLVTIYRHYNLK